MAASPDQVAALADELATLAKGLAGPEADPTAKKRQTHAVVQKLKSAITQIQDPLEACMQHTTNFFVIGAARSLMEIGVFEAVPASGSIGIQDLARKCEADEDLIIRLMRQLTCVGIFNEVKISEWSHNPQSFVMSTHAGMTGRSFFLVCVDEMMSTITQFHLYLRQFGKKDVHTYTDTPHSWANNKLGLTFWEVLVSEPGRVEAFSRGLSLFEGRHPVLGVFPFEELLKANNSPERPLVVDVGGGRGLALLNIRDGCPSLKGKLVLQDRKEVLESIRPEELPGVEKMVHDFFTPQPVKGAQVYYIRRVFHDWQDDEACKILQAIIPAMAPDSRILISDMALPEPVGPDDDIAIWLDLMMMAIGGKERTKRDWGRLMDKAGLKLVKLWQTPQTGPLAVVECMLRDGEKKDGGDGVLDGNVAKDGGQRVLIGHETADEAASTNDVKHAAGEADAPAAATKITADGADARPSATDGHL